MPFTRSGMAKDGDNLRDGIIRPRGPAELGARSLQVEVSPFFVDGSQVPRLI